MGRCTRTSGQGYLCVTRKTRSGRPSGQQTFLSLIAYIGPVVS